MLKLSLNAMLGVVGMIFFHATVGHAQLNPPTNDHLPNPTLCSTFALRNCTTDYGSRASNTCNGVCEIGGTSCVGKVWVFVSVAGYMEQIPVPPKAPGGNNPFIMQQIVCVEQSKCETCIDNPLAPGTGICEQEVWWPLEVHYIYNFQNTCRGQ